MPIDSQTRQLLLRWKSLADGDGLSRAYAMIRVLWGLEIVATAIVVVAVIEKLHPAISGVAGIFAGWVIAERHALRNRLPLWQKLKTYIDWNRVRPILTMPPNNLVGANRGSDVGNLPFDDGGRGSTPEVETSSATTGQKPSLAVSPQTRG